MSLRDEIELNRDFVSKEEEVLLAMVYSSQLLEKRSAEFLGNFSLTSTQFNALMIVRDYEKEGIKQVELARRLLVNRASVGTLIDRLCKLDYLKREPVPDDRRAYNLVLTPTSRALLNEILPTYYSLVDGVFGQFPKQELEAALQFLERFRVIVKGDASD